MSEKISIALEQRTIIGKRVHRLRKQGIIPATIYGKGVAPIAVQLPLRAFNDLLRQAGRSKLIELQVPGQPTISSFIHVTQRHPVSRAFVHVDFLAVDLKIAVTVAIPVHIIGESDMVVRGDAVLNQTLTTIEVRALPANLPSSVTVDISSLDSPEKAIHVRDLSVPSDAEIVTDGDLIAVGLTLTRAGKGEEEEETTTEATDQPELVRKEKEDEE